MVLVPAAAPFMVRVTAPAVTVKFPVTVDAVEFMPSIVVPAVFTNVPTVAVAEFIVMFATSPVLLIVRSVSTFMPVEVKEPDVAGSTTRSAMRDAFPVPLPPVNVAEVPFTSNVPPVTVPLTMCAAVLPLAVSV